MTRLMVMTFAGTERFHEGLPDLKHAADAAHPEENAFAPGDVADDETHGGVAVDDDDDEEHHHIPHDFKPHESPWTMTVPLVILAFLSTVGGLVGVPYALSSMLGRGDINVFEHVLEPVIVHVGSNAEHAKASAMHNAEPAAEEPSAEGLSTERSLAGLSVVLAGFGILIGWFAFSSTPLRKMPKILAEKWRIDDLYNGYIVDPLTNLSREGLWKGIDLGFVDGIVNGIGHFVIETGGIVRRVQVGFVRSYAAIILMGALVVIGYFIYYGWKLVV
jgi:NADH-quinone oxidoreductase subunit L